MHALASVWAERFHRFHPDANIRVSKDQALAADGFDGLLAGRVDCVLMVREPFLAEMKAYCQKFGAPPRLVNVAGGSFDTRGGTHAIAIYVNAANPLAQLSLVQLDAIFSRTRLRGGKEIKTWGQLGLTGLNGEWANRPIHVYTMLTRRETGNPPGIVNFLEWRMLDGGRFRDDVREQRDVPGETSLEAIVHRVAEDESGIGFSGFAYQRPGVKTLALAETAAGPYMSGSSESVASRAYPLRREIYVLLKHLGGDEHADPVAPLLQEFLRMILSREGQQAVAADKTRFLPLSAAQAAQALAPASAATPFPGERFLFCP